MEATFQCQYRPQLPFPVATTTTTATATAFPRPQRVSFAAMVARNHGQVHEVAAIEDVLIKEAEKKREELVELMESLEREAIMGEDEGIEPEDYDRRAKIFDKSSRVFLAFKQLHDNNPSPHRL